MNWSIVLELIEHPIADKIYTRNQGDGIEKMNDIIMYLYHFFSEATMTESDEIRASFTISDHTRPPLI